MQMDSINKLYFYEMEYIIDEYIKLEEERNNKSNNQDTKNPMGNFNPNSFVKNLQSGIKMPSIPKNLQ